MFAFLLAQIIFTFLFVLNFFSLNWVYFVVFYYCLLYVVTARFSFVLETIQNYARVILPLFRCVTSAVCTALS